MSRPQLRAIVLAFNAEWSLGGGLAYLAETVRGHEPCELCRITYGGVTKKGEWKKCEKDIRAPVREVYRNQVDGALAEAIGERFPMVLAETDSGYRVLVEPAQMSAFEGDPLRLHQAMIDGIERHDIQVGRPPEVA